MMLPILLLFVLSVNGDATGDHTIACPYLYEKQYLYQRKTILTISGTPTCLVVEPNSEDLYFTLEDHVTPRNGSDPLEMDTYVLRKGEATKITNVASAKATTIDTINDQVYIASKGGLYVVNETNKANFVDYADLDILEIFQPHNKNYFYAIVDFRVVRLNTKQLHEVQVVEEIPRACILAVDSEDNIYFHCDSLNVQVLLKGFRKPIQFIGIPEDDINALAVDDDGQVVAAATGGLYHLRPDNVIPRKLMDLDFEPTGLAYSGQDIYIANDNIIYKYSRENCET